MTAAPPPSADKDTPCRVDRVALFTTGAVMAAFATSRLAVLGVAAEREYDEGVYLLSARAVAAGEQLFTGVFSSQPPAFLESLALVLRVAGDRIGHAQWFSLFWALVAMAAVAGLARRVAGPLAAPLAATALMAGATFTDLGHMVQAEMPALALALVAMVLVLSSRERGWSRPGLLLGGTAFAGALLFKLFVAPLVLPFGMLLLLEPGREWNLQWRGAARRVALVAAAGALVLALPLLVYDPSEMYRQTVAFHLAKFDVYRATPAGNLKRAFLALADDPAVTAAAFAGLLLLARRRRLAALWLGAWFALMLAVVRGQNPLFWRHLVLLAPPLAVLAGAAFALPLAGRGASVRRAGAAAAMILLLLPAAIAPKHGRALVPTLPHPEWLPWPSGGAPGDVTAAPLTTAAAWIREHSGEGDLVAGDDPIALYLSGRRAPGALCDTSNARIHSGWLTLEEASRHSSRARVIVLREDGRLSKLPGYLLWLTEHFDEQDASKTGVSRNRSVWLRKVAPAG